MARLLTEKAQNVLDRFRYHPVTRSGVRDFHEKVREHTGALAVWYEQHLPDTEPEFARGKALALTKLQEAAMYANFVVAAAQAELGADARKAPFAEVEVEVPAACPLEHVAPPA